MTDYIEKALEGDYKDFIKSLIKIVGNEIDKKKIPLRDAADLIIRDAFYEMRGDKSSLDKLMLSANECLPHHVRMIWNWKTVRLIRLLRKLEVMNYTCHKKPEHYPDRTGLDVIKSKT